MKNALFRGWVFRVPKTSYKEHVTDNYIVY